MENNFHGHAASHYSAESGPYYEPYEDEEYGGRPMEDYGGYGNVTMKHEQQGVEHL